MKKLLGLLLLCSNFYAFSMDTHQSIQLPDEQTIKFDQFLARRLELTLPEKIEGIRDDYRVKASINECSLRTNEDGNAIEVNLTPFANEVIEHLAKENKSNKKKLKNLTFSQRHPYFVSTTTFGLGLGIMSALCWKGSFHETFPALSTAYSKIYPMLSTLFNR